MDRTLYSFKSGCSGGCKYCFAQWGEHAPDFPPVCTEFAINRTKKHIVYPCCDDDFVFSASFNELLEELSRRQNLIVSISTKQWLSDDMLFFLKHIDEVLRGNGGFLKLGISITTRSMVEEIEPGAASYQARLETLKRIASTGIPFAVTLKPILPFISLEEYQAIIDDTAFVGRYLMGSLYVDPETEFFRKYIHEKYATVLQEVNWVNGDCRWISVVQDQRINQLQRYIEMNNMQGFLSDVALVETLCLLYGY